MLPFSPKPLYYPHGSLIGINEIMSIIPHRYPFLLIDRVTEITLKKSIVGIKVVTNLNLKVNS